jgi:nucleoid DNA-binding protein
MNKSELTALIASRQNIKTAAAERILASVLDSIVFALGEGNDISITGFGSFVAQERKAREGRNPRTGETLHIAAYKQPAFKAGKKLKDACNG